MKRIRVNPYGPSKSARELARYLGVKRLLSNGRSRFMGRRQDVIINWGKGRGNIGRAKEINPIRSVEWASNKKICLEKLKGAGVSVPIFYTQKDSIEENKVVVARTSLYGHSGEGIVVGKPYEVPSAPLYVEYIPKAYEYRAIVVGDRVMDFKQKLKRASPRDDAGNIMEETRITHNPHVWNVGGGYIFARNDIRHPEVADIMAIKAIQVLGLDFGAVDIIEDEAGEVFILEVNTAFGLEGQTISIVGDAIKELL